MLSEDDNIITSDSVVTLSELESRPLRNVFDTAFNPHVRSKKAMEAVAYLTQS